ncbi:MAG TPA: hypothetical protein VGQ52_10210 [Gemmatimonadaceae bacterium]|jgi:hypothetical protein|nr:hypothetical protein [Gemmatimonadaceae bacterium]
MKPRPLSRLFNSPRQLLDKARRDLVRLEKATFAQDENGRRDAMMDACVSVFHVKDWIGAMCSGYKADAEKHARTSKWISLCRVICHASKHVGLDLDRPPYSIAPPAAEKIDHTISAPVATSVRVPALKVFSARYGDHLATEVIRNAIAEWDSFLAGKNIP